MVRRKEADNSLSLVIYSPSSFKDRLTNKNKNILRVDQGTDFVEKLNKSKKATGYNFKKPKAYCGIGADVKTDINVLCKTATMTITSVNKDGLAAKKLGLIEGDKIIISGLGGKNNKELHRNAIYKIRNLGLEKDVKFIDKNDVPKDVNIEKLGELLKSEKNNPSVFLKEGGKYSAHKYKDIFKAINGVNGGNNKSFVL
jgi:hypothetical protein